MTRWRWYGFAVALLVTLAAPEAFAVCAGLSNPNIRPQDTPSVECSGVIPCASSQSNALSACIIEGDDPPVSLRKDFGFGKGNAGRGTTTQSGKCAPGSGSTCPSVTLSLNLPVNVLTGLINASGILTNPLAGFFNRPAISLAGLGGLIAGINIPCGGAIPLVNQLSAGVALPPTSVAFNYSDPSVSLNVGDATASLNINVPTSITLPGTDALAAVILTADQLTSLSVTLSPEQVQLLFPTMTALQIAALSPATIATMLAAFTPQQITLTLGASIDPDQSAILVTTPAVSAITGGITGGLGGVSATIDLNAGATVTANMTAGISAGIPGASASASVGPGGVALNVKVGLNPIALLPGIQLGTPPAIPINATSVVNTLGGSLNCSGSTLALPQTAINLVVPPASADITISGGAITTPPVGSYLSIPSGTPVALSLVTSASLTLPVGGTFKANGVVVNIPQGATVTSQSTGSGSGSITVTAGDPPITNTYNYTFDPNNPTQVNAGVNISTTEIAVPPGASLPVNPTGTLVTPQSVGAVAATSGPADGTSP